MNVKRNVFLKVFSRRKGIKRKEAMGTGYVEQSRRENDQYAGCRCLFRDEYLIQVRHGEEPTLCCYYLHVNINFLFSCLPYIMA